ncbi:MAG: hypothetical protein M1836_004589 [Candelina mexicana]|nr:MAG: hypothetical protein M1836_004589 [Candelina mexicana]
MAGHLILPDPPVIPDDITGRPPAYIDFFWFLAETRRRSGDARVVEAGFEGLRKAWDDWGDTFYSKTKRFLPQAHCPRGYRQWKEMQAGIARYQHPDENLVLNLIPMPKDRPILFMEGFMGLTISIKDYGSKTLKALQFKDLILEMRKPVHYKLLKKIWSAIIRNEYPFESEAEKTKALDQAEGEEILAFCKDKRMLTDEVSGAQHIITSSSNDVVILPTPISGQMTQYRDYGQAYHLLNSFTIPSRELLLKGFENVVYSEVKTQYGRDPTRDELNQEMHRRLPWSLFHYWQAVERSYDLRRSTSTAVNVSRTLIHPIELQCHLLIVATEDGMFVPLTRIAHDNQWTTFEDFVRHYIYLNKDNGKLDADSIMTGWKCLCSASSFTHRSALRTMGDLNEARRLLRENSDSAVIIATTAVGYSSQEADQQAQETSAAIREAEKDSQVCDKATSSYSSERISVTEEPTDDLRGIGNVGDEASVDILNKRKANYPRSDDDSDETIVCPYQPIKRRTPAYKRGLVLDDTTTSEFQEENHNKSVSQPEANLNLVDHPTRPTAANRPPRYHNTRAAARLMAEPNDLSGSPQPTQVVGRTGFQNIGEWKDHYRGQNKRLRRTIRECNLVLKEQGVTEERFQKENQEVAEALALNRHLMAVHKALSVRATQQIELNPRFDVKKATQQYERMQKKRDHSWNPDENDDFVDEFANAGALPDRGVVTMHETACPEAIGSLGADREAQIPPLTEKHAAQDKLTAVRLCPTLSAQNIELKEEVVLLKDRIHELEAQQMTRSQGNRGSYRGLSLATENKQLRDDNKRLRDIDDMKEAAMQNQNEAILGVHRALEARHASYEQAEASHKTLLERLAALRRTFSSDDEGAEGALNGLIDLEQIDQRLDYYQNFLGAVEVELKISANTEESLRKELAGKSTELETERSKLSRQSDTVSALREIMAAVKDKEAKMQKDLEQQLTEKSTECENQRLKFEVSAASVIALQDDLDNAESRIRTMRMAFDTFRSAMEMGNIEGQGPTH